MLTRWELAHKLRVSVSTVDNYRRAGRIPSVKIGPRKILFDLPAVRRALELPPLVTCPHCGRAITELPDEST